MIPDTYDYVMRTNVTKLITHHGTNDVGQEEEKIRKSLAGAIGAVRPG